MESAPESIPPITVSAFAALFAPHGPGTVSIPANSPGRPTRSASIAGASSPACDTRFGSSNE